MQIIKEFRPATDDGGSAIAVIRSNTYGSSLEKFQRFFEIAKETFPKLEPRDIKITQYGGERYKRTFGIEFVVDKKIKSLVQHGYRDIEELESTL